MIRYLGSLNSLEWNLTLKNENWTSLQKKIGSIFFKSEILLFRVTIYSKSFKEYFIMNPI